MTMENMYLQVNPNSIYLLDIERRRYFNGFPSVDGVNEIIKNAAGGKNIGELYTILCDIDNDKNVGQGIEKAKSLLSVITPKEFDNDRKKPCIKETPILHAICECAAVNPVLLGLVEFMLTLKNLEKIIRSKLYKNYKQQSLLKVMKNYAIICACCYEQFNLEQRKSLQLAITSYEDKLAKTRAMKEAMKQAKQIECI